MAGELATGYIQILPSMGGVKTTIEKELGGAGDSAGRKSGSLFGSAMKKYISAAAIGTALYKSITAGAALEQSLGGVETLYKEHADIVIANADRAWKTAGVSANQYMEQSTSFAATLLNSLNGDTAKAAQYADRAIVDMSDNANKFGTDIGSLQVAYQGFAKQNYTMLDNLKLGYGGTKTEMERLIADASKMTDVQDELNLSVKDGDLSFSNIVNAISVMQSNLGVAGTTAEEAATTLSGSFNAMKSAAENLIGDLALGRNIAPAMKALSSSIGTFLFDNLIPALGNVFKSLPSAIGTFLYDGIPQLLASMQKFLNDLAGAFTNSGDIFAKAMSGMLDLSKIILDNSGNIIKAGLALAMNLAKGLANSLPVFIKTVPQIISNLADVINTNAPTILGAGVKIAGTLALGIIKAIPTLVASIPQIFSALVKVWMALNWLNLGKMAITKIQTGITTAGKSVLTAVKNLINKIKGMFPFNVGKIFSNIKLPKITASGGKAPWGLLGEGTPPKFSVKWNAKGGIFDSASIIGYGVGERGAEAILPLNTFWEHMTQMGSDIVDGVGMQLRANAMTSNGGSVVLYAFPNGPKMDEWIVESYNRGSRRGLT